MKTAIQELLEEVTAQKKWSTNVDYRDALNFVELVIQQDYLEKEKEQIIDAANFDSRSVSENGYRRGEQYYNDKYNTNEK
jgi:hypothetical protein